MALPMTPIFTQTVGSGGAVTVTFNNIPQHYTDLKLVVSARSSASGGNSWVGPLLVLNGGSNTIGSQTQFYGVGSTVYTDRNTSNYSDVHINSSTSTANTFSNVELYFPNYTSSNYKQVIIDTAVENNSATNNLILLKASLVRDTNPITSISLNSGNFVQYSTISLYGIIRSGA